MKNIQVVIILFWIVLILCDECGPTNEEFAEASLKYVETMKKLPAFDDYIKLSIKEHSEFADPITVKYCRSDCFVRNNIKTGKEYVFEDEHIMQTSIGNIAYMALYSNYKTDYKRMYKSIITAVHEVINRDL